MLNARAYESYFGGKSGNGTFQTIINHIPPHDIFMSLFLGNCGITRKIRPAKQNILNDLDKEVIEKWQKIGLPDNYDLTNSPALEILKFITPPPEVVFIFLDPPYRKESRKSKYDIYRHEMTDKDHIELLTQLVQMEYMPNLNIMISHYPDPVYNSYLAGWQTVDYYSMTRNGLALERLYMNYKIQPGILHDYRYIGKGFREREAFNRIRRNLIKKLNTLSPDLRNAVLADINSHYNAMKPGS